MLILGVHIIFGLVIQSVALQVGLAGLRNYFKFIPFFFLPAVFGFSEYNLKKQIPVLLALTLIQFPLAIFQRFVRFRGVGSGDFVTGTLSSSGIMSVYLVCSLGLIIGFYLKKLIGFRVFLMLFFAIFIPTTLNETKGTFVLLPIVILVPLFLINTSSKVFKKYLILLVMSGLAMVVFVTTYEQLYSRRNVLEFYTQKEALQGYLYKSAGTEGYNEPGKIDSIVLPIHYLSKDPADLYVGVGIGNASPSFIPRTGGRFKEVSKSMGFGMTTFGNLIWEMGIVGALLFSTFVLLILKDAVRMSKTDGIDGAIGFGWVIVSVVIFFSFFYKHVFNDNAVGYLFWYFSGYVAFWNYKHRVDI